MDLRLSERYELASDPILGDGDLAQVVRARDRLLDLPVVLKILRPVLATDAGFRRAFDAAVHAAGRITHPNLVPMHDSGETPAGLPFVAYARAEGGSFAAFAARPPPWSELVVLVQSVLDALACLHARGGVHRRLKPTNLLLHPDGDGGRRVWVADAGLAAITARAEPLDLTPSAWAAPEQRAGAGTEIGPATDLYALGVILWELTTGRTPFVAGEHGPLPRYAPVIAVPSGLEAVLANLLAADPLSRYDLAADVRTEMDGLASGRPIARVEPSRAPEPEPAAVQTPAPVSVRLGGRTPAPAATPVPADRAAERVRVNRDPPSVPTNRPDVWDGEESPGLWVRGREEQVPSDDVSDLGLNEDEPLPVIVWNRPFPPEMPAEPPLEVGLGDTARASLRLFAGREIPLVGREAEVAAIWTAARAVVAARRPKVVVVVGEAGSGRTRLIRSVTRTLEERGHAETVWMAYGEPATDDDGPVGAARTLLRPWGETRSAVEARICRRLTRERTPEPATPPAEIRAEAAALARWCEVGGEGDTPAAERPVPFALGLREIFRHLDAHGWRGLACLVLDDARLATEPGDGLDIAGSFVDAVDDGVPGMLLLILVSVRTEDLAADAALRDRLERWVARGALRVDLPRLGLAETDALVEEGVSLSSDLRSRVLARCAGNPLVARQLVLAWADRDALVPNHEGPGFVLRDPADPVPSDLPSLLDHRLEALASRSGLTRRFLDLVHLVALAGRSVPRGLVEGFAGPDLEAFVHGCGLWIVGGDRLVFDSTTVHQHVVARAERRPDASYLHRRLARAWGRLAPARGAALEAGRHGVLAGDAAFGVPWLLRAAEGSRVRDLPGALDRSSRLAFEAVLADPALSSLRGTAMLWRAHALVSRGEPSDAMALFVAARDVLLGSGDTLLAIDALLGLGAVRLDTGDTEAADWLFADAVNRARQASAPRHEARGLAGQARVELYKRGFEPAAGLFARAATRARQLSDTRTAGDALLGQGFVARRIGRWNDADAHYEQARLLFRSAPDPVGEIRAGIGLANVAFQRNPRGIGERRFAVCTVLAQRVGAPLLQIEARLGLAHVARVRGDRERAARMYGDCADRALREGATELAVASALGRAQLALDQGELGVAYEQTTLAASALDELPGHWLWASYRLVVATLLAHRRDHTSTWQWLWSAQEVGLGETVDRDTADGLVAICEVAAEAGWANVVRLAGKIGTEQLERLNDEEGATRLKQKVATALL